MLNYQPLYRDSYTESIKVAQYGKAKSCIASTADLGSKQTSIKFLYDEDIMQNASVWDKYSKYIYALYAEISTNITAGL